MVFYVPPLNPVITALDSRGKYTADYDTLIPTIDKLRIPIKYLANMFAAGNEEEIRKALKRLIAIREFFRLVEVEGKSKAEAAYVLEQNGLTLEDADKMYRWLALGRDRWIIPTRKIELRMKLPKKAGGR